MWSITRGVQFCEIVDAVGVFRQRPCERMNAVHTRPQLVRLGRLAHVYGVTALDILASTAEYIYQSSGEPIPNPALVSIEK